MKVEAFKKRVRQLEHQRRVVEAMQRATARGAKIEVTAHFDSAPDWAAPAPAPATEPAPAPAVLGRSVAENCLQNEADRIEYQLQAARSIEQTVADFAEGKDL